MEQCLAEQNEKKLAFPRVTQESGNKEGRYKRKKKEVGQSGGGGGGGEAALGEEPMEKPLCAKLKGFKEEE